MGCRGSPVQIWPPRPITALSRDNRRSSTLPVVFCWVTAVPYRMDWSHCAGRTPAMTLLLDAHGDRSLVVGVLPVEDCAHVLQHHSLDHLPYVLDAGSIQGAVADRNVVPGVPQQGRGPHNGRGQQEPVGAVSMHQFSNQRHHSREARDGFPGYQDSLVPPPAGGMP